VAYLEFQAADSVALELQSGDVKSVVFQVADIYLGVLALHAASLELEAGGKVSLEFQAAAVLWLEIHGSGCGDFSVMNGFFYMAVGVECYFLSLICGML
jgi:hypothetical protein